MRVKIKLLVKSLIIVVLLLFILPLIINHLDSPEDDVAHRRKKLRHPPPGHNPQDIEDEEKRKFVEDMKRKERFAVANIRNKTQRVDAVLPRPHAGEAGDEGDAPNPFWGPKVYGPKAHLTPKELGNYEPTIPYKTGPGEGGQAVFVSMAEKAAADQSVKEYGFNMVASDKIAMNRTIPDTRLDECKYWQYPDQLPTVSVIIVFHNEGWSTLLRTVHSVINMSPPHLLHEVVMIDDFSNKDHLRGRLDEYIRQFNGKVKLYRNKERLGLIGTRTAGARYSTGDVILFLDAHCECNKNWLPPLLARIAYDRTIMAVPIIDGVDWNTMRYNPVYQANEQFRGIFEWGFLYKESKVPQRVLKERDHMSEPYKSPTHAGGLFAMDREYFFELGAYDPGLQIWGGENFELSFKIWQCGGSIEWVPCSRVGHIYRNHMPYSFGNINHNIPVILLNYMRVVEVWLDDEHKEYFYTREPTVQGYPVGDITAQLDFKEKHQCKSFQWFLDNVAFEVEEKFPPPPPNVAWGEIKLRLSSECWDSKGQHPGGGPLGVSACHHYGGNQLFRLNADGQIAMGERCIDASGETLHVIYCPVRPNGHWSYEQGSGLIHHAARSLCAQADPARGTLHLKTCDSTNKNQQYDINEIKTWKRT